ncbi:MAG: ABC transporter ATP-binding protein [Thermodesulfobacteriota bacterium]|nr:ABC transporter ATP-binding protein [Thermodesulfobacteriota bacterium]
MNIAIDIKNLNYAYGKYVVLTDVSFRVKRGDFFIIIGPNGSGKTTLMSLISGIIRPKKGQLEVFGMSMQGYTRKALARTIAFVPQMVEVDFPFTVNEVVLMGRSPHQGILGLEKREDLEIAKQAIAFTGLEHLSHRKLTQLSGGELQRVYIAKAICQEPRIMLLDEPTASLDLAHQTRLMDLMEKLREERGLTIVMVSHDVNLAAMYGQNLLLLKEGQIVSSGFPEKVLTYENLEHAYGCTLLVDDSPLGRFPRVTLVPQRVLDNMKHI